MCGGRTRRSGSSGWCITRNPYGELEPGAGPEGPAPRYPEPGGSTALLRGLRKRCPRCASPEGFEGYFQLRTRCPRCGLPFMKEEGGFLGAMTLNYLIAVLLWLVLLVVWVTLTVPDIPVAPILVASIAVLAVVPIWFYPRSKMIWAAVEYLVARTQPDYRPPGLRDPRTDGLE